MSRSYKKRKNIYVHNQMFSEICDMNNYIFGYKSIYLSTDYLYQSKLSKGNKTVYCKNSVLNKYLNFELMIHKNDAVIAHLFNLTAIHIRCFYKRYSFH